MRQKQTRISLSIVLMITIILFSIVLPSIQAIDITEEDLKAKADFLKATFTTANISVTKTIAHFENDNISQSSLNYYRDAQDLANKSSALYLQGNYSGAISFALQALQKLKETFTSIYQTTEDEPTEQEIIHQQTLHLKSMIERNFSIYQNLKNMTIAATTHGINVTAIIPKLDQIKNNLDNAADSLLQGNLTLAENKTKDAKVIIDELTIFFESIATTLKTEKVENYLTETEQRLSTLSQQLNSVSNQLSASSKAASIAALTQAQNSLSQAKQYMDSQQIDQTIDELIAAKAKETIVNSYIDSTTIKPTPTPTLTQNSTRSQNTDATSSSIVKTNP